MPRALRLTLYLLGGALALLLLLAAALAPLWLEPIVADRLRAAVRERSGGQYALDVGDVDLSVFGRRLALRDARLRLADSTQRTAAAAALTGGLLVEGDLGVAAVRGLRYWPLLTERRVRFDSLVLERPRLRVTDARSATDGATDADSDAPRNTGAGSGGAGGSGGALPAGGLQIGGVRVTDADVAYGYRLDTAAATLTLDGLDAAVADVRVEGLGPDVPLLSLFGYATARLGGFRAELPDSLHVLRVAAAGFDTRGARLTLDSLRVRPRLPGFSLDGGVDAGQPVTPDAPAALALDADAVELAGLDLRALLQRGRVRARRLRVDTATAEVYRGRRGGGGGAPLGGRVVTVDSVDLRGVALAYNSAAPRTRLEVPRAELLLTDLALGPDARDTSGRLFRFAEGHLLARDGLRYAPGVGDEVRFREARLDIDAGALDVDGFRLGPALRPDGAPTGGLTVAAERFGVSRLDVPRLIWDGDFAAGEVTAEGLVVAALTDLRTSPPDRGPRDLTLVNLQHLPVDLELDRVTVADAAVRYRRVDADTDVTLEFADTDATFYHVGTTAAYARDHPRAEVDIRSRFQDILPLRVAVDWPNAAGVPYRLECETDALPDLTRANAFLEPLADLRIEGGSLERLAFSWTSSDTRAEGRLEATYRGFRVNLLDDSGDDKDVISLFANVAAVREEANGRSARVTVTREPTQGMFGHWWAIIRAGLRRVVLNDVGEAVTGGGG